jgi:hypothetical protein
MRKSIFAVQTRRQELSDAQAADLERLELRKQTSEEFKALSGAARESGVQSKMFGVFHGRYSAGRAYQTSRETPQKLAAQIEIGRQGCKGVGRGRENGMIPLQSKIILRQFQAVLRGTWIRRFESHFRGQNGLQF